MLTELIPLLPAGTELESAYHGTHNPFLVLLSILIATGAAYASFSHATLIKQTRSVVMRRLWMLNGAITMGLGVWAMHFTGMLSYQLPFSLSYDPYITAISVIPAVIAGAVTLWILNARRLTVSKTLLAGVVMGAGIGTMHYVGMAGVLVPATMYYKPGWFFSSIGAAVVLATASLAIPYNLKERFRQSTLVTLIAAAIMGAAIASMHYIAMHATIFLRPEQDTPVVTEGMLAEGMAASTLIIAIVLMTLGIFASAMRSRLSGARFEARLSEARANEALARLNKVAARIPGMVYQISKFPDGRFTMPYASGAITSLFEVAPEDVRKDASPAIAKVHESDLPDVLQTIEQSAQSLTPWKLEFRVNTEQGERWYFGNSVPEKDENGVVSWSGFITDITDDKAQKDRVHQLAYFDALTGLANRSSLVEELRDYTDGVIIRLNLNNFRKLNEAYGPIVGDSLLRQVAERLESIKQEPEFLARYAADEFVLVFALNSDEAEQPEEIALERARAILAIFEQPFDLGGLAYTGQCRAGVTFIDPQTSSEDLLKQADLAVHDIQRFGSSPIRIFDPKTQSLVSQRFDLERELAQALTDNHLELHFQLQMNRDGEPAGAEGLARWNHPERGMVSPGVFIPIAEESGHIIELGNFVLIRACEQLSKWQQSESTRNLAVAINVSPRQFFQEDFVDRVINQLEAANIPPKLLILEITESVLLDNQDIVAAKMNQLREYGVRFALDDFGTGFSSLSHLCTLPFDEVKIDQMFTRNLSDDKSTPEWAVVEAVIHIANRLNIKVVAEGVETEQQRDMLLEAGCQLFQGYWYSKPMSADELPV